MQNIGTSHYYVSIHSHKGTWHLRKSKIQKKYKWVCRYSPRDQAFLSLPSCPPSSPSPPTSSLSNVPANRQMNLHLRVNWLKFRGVPQSPLLRCARSSSWHLHLNIRRRIVAKKEFSISRGCPWWKNGNTYKLARMRELLVSSSTFGMSSRCVLLFYDRILNDLCEDVRAKEVEIWTTAGHWYALQILITRIFVWNKENERANKLAFSLFHNLLSVDGCNTLRGFGYALSFHSVKTILVNCLL